MADSAIQGWFWLSIALVGAIGEVMLPSFFMIFISFAAPFAAILAFLGAPWTWQIFVFSVMLALGFIFFRPLILKKFQKKDVIPESRASVLTGKIGVVTEAIIPSEGLGRVLVEGEDWAARAASEIPKDSRVRIKGYDSIVLLVEKA